MTQETLADAIGQKDAIKLTAAVMAAKYVAILERNVMKISPADGRDHFRKRVFLEVRRMAAGVASGKYSAIDDLDKVYSNCVRRTARRKGRIYGI
jgi:hypothetical protein